MFNNVPTNAPEFDVYLMLDEFRIGQFRIGIVPVQVFEDEFNPIQHVTRLSETAYSFEDAAYRIRDIYMLLGRMSTETVSYEQAIKDQLVTPSQFDIDELTDALRLIRGFQVMRGRET